MPIHLDELTTHFERVETETLIEKWIGWWWWWWGKVQQDMIHFKRRDETAKKKEKDYYANWKSSPIVLLSYSGGDGSRERKWVGKVMENQGKNERERERVNQGKNYLLVFFGICSSKQDSKICRLSRYSEGFLEWWWDDIMVVHCIWSNSSEKKVWNGFGNIKKKKRLDGCRTFIIFLEQNRQDCWLLF